RWVWITIAPFVTHKGDLLIAALVHDPRLRAALADSHHRPVIYEVSK
ncbi:TPA: hypothetical protein ACNBNI_005653, partial [Escherichia coli]